MMEEIFRVKYIDFHTHVPVDLYQSGRGVCVNDKGSGSNLIESSDSVATQEDCVIDDGCVVVVRSVTPAEYRDDMVGGVVEGQDPRRVTVGIYPFGANDEDIEVQFELLRRILTEDRGVFGVGEVGLDYREPFRDFSSKQVEVFERQIELARLVERPIVVHQVKALDDTLNCLKGVEVPVIFHGFSGSYESACRILDRGFYLSFGKMLLVNDKLRETLKKIPADRLFLETDQHEVSIREIYRAAATVMNLTEEDLKLIIHRNFSYVDTLARENRAFIGR